MSDARAKRLRDLAWPPTCACYVSHLNGALRRLIEKAERLNTGSTLPGYNVELGERDLWFEVHGVQITLGISHDIPRDDYPFLCCPKRGDAERWLDRLLSDVRISDPGVPPPDAKTQARRLSSPEHIQAFREILSLVPDPFDCPNGQALELFEWARHHLETGPDEWDFEAKVDNRFWNRWSDACIADNERRPENVCREIRRGLLIEAGLLRCRTPNALRTLTEVTDYKLAVEQVKTLVEAIGRFVFEDERSRYTGSWCLQDEYRLPGFLGVADALRPFRDSGWKSEGWPEWVSNWLPDVVGVAAKTFAEIAGCWGWEGLLKPRFQREDYIKDCDRRFRECYLVPIQTACKESAKLFDAVSRPPWIEKFCVSLPSMDFDSLDLDFQPDSRLGAIREVRP